MAKAQIRMPDGIVVDIDGTPAEITAVVQKLRYKPNTSQAVQHTGHKEPGRTLLVDLVASLIDSGFFKKPRSLGDIKAALEGLGHRYPVTTLSAAMLRQVRRRNLRRLRENKVWAYVR